MQRVCRICLHKISDFSYVSLTGGLQSQQVKNELTFCIPEMAWDSVSEAVMCTGCVKALHSAYDFKRLCLQTEERIQNYKQSLPAGVSIDIAEICDPDSYLEVTPSHTSSKSEMQEDSSQTYTIEHNLTKIKEEFLLSDYEPAPQDSEVMEDFIPDVELGQNSLAIKPFEDLGDVPLECPTCKYKTVEMSTLLKHMAAHGPGNLFKCNQCSFSTVHRYTWVSHVQEHTDRSYKCDSGEFVTHNQNLGALVPQHKSDKPYQCHLCAYRSGEKSKLRRHLLTHGNEKPFTCHICSFSTTRSDALKKHLNCHKRKETMLIARK